MSEKFVTLMEPDNEVVKYAACVKKKNVVISHIPLGKNQKLTKIVFFSTSDQYATFEVIITDKPPNFGDGMQVPSNLRITGKKDQSDILEKKLFKFIGIILKKKKNCNKTYLSFQLVNHPREVQKFGLLSMGPVIGIC